jgi:hypothetical protein
MPDAGSQRQVPRSDRRRLPPSDLEPDSAAAGPRFSELAPSFPTIGARAMLPPTPTAPPRPVAASAFPHPTRATTAQPPPQQAIRPISRRARRPIRPGKLFQIETPKVNTKNYLKLQNTIINSIDPGKCKLSFFGILENRSTQ